jgi:Flp pilus assembly protein TadD
LNLLAKLLLLSLTASASQDLLDRAKELYQRTDYQASLQLLSTDPAPNAATHCLIGKNHFMQGEWKQAMDSFEQAVELAPTDAEYALWLGRAYGRRAETSNWMIAGFLAAKTRQYLEKAVALSPHYNEALNDLFAYYLEAPGFLGGGTDKAEAIAQRIAERSPAEYHFAEAQLAEKRKDYPAAEQHLHQAIEQAPREVGRVIDLATYLARRGRLEDSDRIFEQAEKLAPGDRRIAFARAKTDIEHKRNLEEARRLLKRYLESTIIPDDPPKQSAEKLLQQAQGP